MFNVIRKYPLKLKGKFCQTIVRSTILYETECWIVKNQHEHKISIAEMRILR